MALVPLPRHGGDLAAAEARWGRPAEGWLDLSTGINPWPYPLPAFAPDLWSRLPGSEEQAVLRHAAAERYGAPSADHVLAAPGTSALIQAVARLLPAGTVSILGPTYAEHAAAWSAAGHRVEVVTSLDEAQGEAVVVVNPNNPDGRLIPPAQFLAAAKVRPVVIDEAFADAVPGASILPNLPPGAVVLRSFGKFYGLAGLRLGFAIAEPGLLARLSQQLGPWPVSGPALAVGAKALADTAWAEETTSALMEAADRLDAILARAGLQDVGGTPLFRLAAHPHAGALWERLGRAGILVRAFPHRSDLLRFGLAPDRAAEDRLAKALQ